jgi:hypothetical protein
MQRHSNSNLIQSGAARMNSSVDLDERGKTLRENIEELYANMKRNKNLRARPHINDLSGFLSTYIPEGISFDDAEHILRSAGFDVLERREANAPDPRGEGFVDKHDVIARMLLPSGFMSRAELMLGMRPKSPGDYSTVKEVWGAFIVTYP